MEFINMDKEDYIEKLEQENKSAKKLINNYKSLVLKHNNNEIDYKIFMDSVVLLTTYKI
tara:strand:- start:300 stop:476 length:177 start_codon:yes stop_codon:yes gene_type:complete